tara:strand:+ start:90 stop:374 length:285 start_codon:yes stop_codon:yes gene_type:complete
MSDGRANNGGAREGAGRPTKADEKQAISRIVTALKVIFSKDDDEDAVTAFLVDYGGTKDGKGFFAQHLLGLPKKNIDVTTNGQELQQITGIEVK